MGPAWLGLLGAVVGGMVSLIGTLVTTRFQWRQEQARWLEQRERDQLQWRQQHDAEMAKWESERRRDTITWERTRGDEKENWLREQKLQSYLEVLDHLLAASELASNLPPAQMNAARPYHRDDEMAIVRELRKSYRWMKSANAVCGKNVAAKVRELSEELYFTLQVVDYEGIKPGNMVRRPESSKLEEWILSEVIDGMSAKVSAILRTDLDAD
jgi:hypothetical protein